MELAIYKFDHDNRLDDLTTIEIGGEIWFVAADVCAMLDIKNITDTVSGLEEDERMTSVLPRSSKNRKVNLVNESGLYSIIFRSKKDTARKFRQWVTKEVIPAIRKTGGYGINRLETPNFVIRFNDNWQRTDKGHFSIISELFIRLYGRFEAAGYRIPNRAFSGKEIRPDVSVGKLFSQYLEANHHDLADEFSYYPHKFPDGMEVAARQYKNELLPIFIEFVDSTWLPQCAHKYFADRDVRALDYLAGVLGRGAVYPTVYKVCAHNRA